VRLFEVVSGVMLVTADRGFHHYPELPLEHPPGLRRAWLNAFHQAFHQAERAR